MNSKIVKTVMLFSIVIISIVIIHLLLKNVNMESFSSVDSTLTSDDKAWLNNFATEARLNDMEKKLFLKGGKKFKINMLNDEYSGELILV